MLDVAVHVRGNWGDSLADDDWAALCARAAETAIALTPRHTLLDDKSTTEIAVLFTDNAEVQALNHQYRDKDAPTNVLSFPQMPPDQIDANALADDGELLLGDIVLAYEICRDEALAKAVVLADHVTHLVIHGTLHLLGYDHNDDRSADAMEAMERDALATLGIADPYALIEDN